MQIYERILRIIAALSGNSQAKFAKSLGIPQTTLFGYLSEKGQSKIRISLLDKILAAYPQVRREWLYFGEGEMLGDGAPQHSGTEGGAREEPKELQEIRTKLAILEAELLQANRLNRQLTMRLLVDGAGDEDALTATGKAGGGAG